MVSFKPELPMRVPFYLSFLIFALLLLFSLVFLRNSLFLSTIKFKEFSYTNDSDMLFIDEDTGR